MLQRDNVTKGQGRNSLT